jgi:hypothetical protein
MDLILKLILIFNDLLSPCYYQSVASKLKSSIFEVIKALIFLVFSLEIWHFTCQCLLQVEVAHPWTIVVEVENIDVLRILLWIEEQLNNHIQGFEIITVQHLFCGLTALLELVKPLV